ncbi:DUF6443 domain-containing protein [Prevotella sp. 10(H)]|uniref:DUF6443 domain-containing protein n=1 Tax=Prevotella sp. 10(H) TaxID=1158294 RepID=UPI00068AA8EF|nr:DUF6443 domain-containing protein [Prevotella sp. 10(H)]
MKRYILFIILNSCLSTLCYSQTFNDNYIISKTYTDASGTQSLDVIQYFDGLGRPVQTVQKGITPSKADLVTYQQYDATGREASSWLPAVASGNNGAFIPFATYKTKAMTTYNNDSAYSRPVYEPSPLNRVLEQYGPGKDWYTGKKAVKTEYTTNNRTSTGAYTGALSCMNLQIEGTTIKNKEYYADGSLYVTRMTDENGNESYEFKDKQGQVILTRQVSGGRSHATYYVYDDYGNLRYVIPPKASDLYDLRSSISESQTDAAALIYIYKYDNRNRCIWKKLPGCEPVYYVYDRADRLILSQDGEQRNRKTGDKSEWTFNKYDAFGRLIMSGIYWTASAHSALQTAYAGIAVKESPGSGNYGYTWNTFPDVAVNDVLLINYYDDYEMMLKTNSYYKTNLDYNAETGYGTRYSNAKGLLVGTRVKLIGPDGKSNNTIEGQIVTAMYYDDRGRLIQTKSTNHLSGGLEKEYIAYNFTGQPTQRKHVHSATGKTTVTEIYKYTYDHAGRLTKTTHKFNSLAETVIAENTYDELGRLKTNKKNGQANLTTTYGYNIRSWTKSITSPLFSQTLYYNESYGGSAKQYNGNISAMNWKVQGETTPRGYAFTYDNLSRLTVAYYLYNGSVVNSFNASYEYDKHGNMTTLKRRGRTSATQAGELIDNLTLTYNGNQLTKAEDAIGTISLAESADFKNYSNVAVEYTYNKNGAMTKDLNKGITDIQYNSLNLPRQMDIKSPVAEARNEYTYSVGGQKLKVVQKWNPGYNTAPVIGSGINVSSLTQSKTTDYVGNIIYENNSLKRVLVDGGYIESNTYHFFLTDHLGNNRVVANASGTVIQKNHYYPFGTAFAENTVSEQGKQPYKYNGKELDQMHGLNMYDYSARFYEPSIGRFSTIDPKAEKYYSISPYAYVANNPLKFIDPTGMALDSVIVNVETTGTGHTWITVGENDKKTTYSYEPESRRNIKSKGNLIVKTGRHAQSYEKGKKKETSVSSYVVKDVTDEDMIKTMDEIISNNTNKKEGAGSNEEGRTDIYDVEGYNFFIFNCTTFTSDALNTAGSKILENKNMYIFGGLKTENDRFVIPHSFKNFLDRKSNINSNIITKIYPMRK